MIRSKASLAFSFTLVFAGGLLVGALAHRYYSLRSVQAVSTPAPPNPEKWRQEYVAELKSRCKLDADQTQRIEGILDNTRARFHELRERFRPEMDAIRVSQIQQINAVLTPAQQQEYARVRKERDDRKKAMDKKNGIPGS